MLHNFNKASLSLDPINTGLNADIERVAMATAEQPRPYLGVSIAGYECARRVQYTWWIKSEHPARVRAIFDRGHYFEGRVKERLKAIGFKFTAEEALAFSAVGGALRGHADGIIIATPRPFTALPAILEVKALNGKNWRSLERDGLEKTIPNYHAQVLLYQAYLDITNPALFAAINADSCELLFFLVPFNAERGSGPTARPISSRPRVRVSCCRGHSMIRKIGAANSARTKGAAGIFHEEVTALEEKYG